MTSREVRETLGLTRIEWARALNVNERTISRWEDLGVDPGGLVTVVIKGIDRALAEGADPAKVSRIVGMGIGPLVYTHLSNGR